MSTPDTMDTIDEAEQAWREYYMERQNLQRFIIFSSIAYQLRIRLNNNKKKIKKYNYVLDFQLSMLHAWK